MVLSEAESEPLALRVWWVMVLVAEMIHRLPCLSMASWRGAVMGKLETRAPVVLLSTQTVFINWRATTRKFPVCWTARPVMAELAFSSRAMALV